MNQPDALPCLFLDRDGVINVDDGYVHSLDRFRFMPGIFDLARVAVALGWRIVVVTNQSGVGRGFYDEAAFHSLADWMRQRFVEEGATLTDVLFCPYHPDAGIGAYRADHPWRKPQPGMIREAQRRHGLDLRRSAIIGDSDSDLAAGLAAGLGLLIKLGAPVSQAFSAPHHHVGDLFQAAALLPAWHEERLGGGER